MMHFTLLIECRHGLGSDLLAPRRPNIFVSDSLVDGAHCVANHVAAIVHFGHDPIGIVPVVGSHSLLRPTIGRGV